MTALVKSLTHIQHVLADPEQRKILENLAPDLVSALEVDNKDLKAAKDGLPSSSKPSKACAHGSDRHLQASSKPGASKAAEAHGNDRHGGSAPDVSATAPPCGSSPSPGPTPSKAEMNEKALDAADEATEDEINSSTHRAAHARLNRRMEKLDPATFPQMSKLWNGTRKD